MASKTIRGVIFDLFGTLIENLDYYEFEDALSKIAELLSVSQRDFARCWNDTWDKRSTGFFATLEADIEHVSRLLNAQPRAQVLSEAARILQSFAQQVLGRTRDDALQTLIILKAAGYKTGLISNCAANIPSVWEKGPLARLIDVPIFSCSIGLKKPNPEVYAIACRKLALSQEKCIYIADGNERELTGASQAGLHVVLFNGPDVDPYDKGLDRQDWTGLAISRLSQIIDILGQSNSHYPINAKALLEM